MQPRKVGLKLEPPSLVVVYENFGKLRMRRMPVRNIWESASTSFILEDLKSRHKILESVPENSLVKMIELLKGVKGGSTLEELLANQTKKSLSDIASYEQDTDFELENDLSLDELKDSW